MGGGWPFAKGLRVTGGCDGAVDGRLDFLNEGEVEVSCLLRLSPFAFCLLLNGGEEDAPTRNFNGGILGRLASSMRLWQSRQMK